MSLIHTQNTFEAHLKKTITRFGKQTKLRDAIEYALLSGGKRFRPLIVMVVSDAIGKRFDVLEAALSLEYFHTASLIADDLPCMDNDDYRRSQPSLHRVYGETTALLASYALIAAGYDQIHKSSQKMRSFSDQSDEACVIALENATRCSGIHGATGGQFLDLFPEGHDLVSVREVIDKKTVTLFEVAFVFGWVFGGGEFSLLSKVRKAAHHFGMAFQIIDDLGDMKQDVNNESEMNMAFCLGKEKALSLFHGEIEKFDQILHELRLNTPSFLEIRELLMQHALCIC